MYNDFGFIGLFILGAFLMLTVILGIAKLLRPAKPTIEKLSTYESGENAEGGAVVNFPVRFYLVGIVFLLFEVELVLLFPWSTVFGNAKLIEETNGSWALYAITEMFVFIGVLVLGLVYAWREGHLDWTKSNQKATDNLSKVPMEVYERVNEKYK